jgi:hypothetical protein
MTFEYKLKGWIPINNEKICNINVKLLKGDLNNQDSLKLEGKEMKCSLPVGVVAAPESDIKKCTGPLKEGLQELIISKMHKYIVQNLGEINQDIY